LNQQNLLLILQKQLGCVPLKATAGHFLLLVAISLPGLYPAGKFYQLLKALTGGVRGFELIPAMAGAALCYLVLYLALAILLKLDEVKILARQIFRKRKGA